MDIANQLPAVRVPQMRQLPLQMTQTIGRAQEISALCALLRRDDLRLLTLTGPGGVGKTRVALEVAREMRADFRDGVFFVSLAPLRDHELVGAALAQALGAEEIAGLPLLERIKAYLADRQLLFVLDNFEHVLPAGELLADLLVAAPSLKLLVTSREILHLYGEHEFVLLPLALPDLSQREAASYLASSAAVSLFVQRAQAVKPSFALSEENQRIIAEICVQLDGLPLAIELAAARIKMLTPQSLLARLHSRLSLLTGGPRNLPARQQTLRNTLDWSYDLLNDSEKRFFRKLGVFVGNWTLEAAEAVALHDNPAEGSDALDLLTSLVDKSLVRPLEHVAGETRFMLLETIREYALDCLEKTGECEQTQKRHTAFYLRVVEEAEPYLQGLEQQGWLARLDREAANFWEVMRRVIERRDALAGLRLASALISYLLLRSHISEGRNWFEEILALQEASQPCLLRARVLYGAGALAYLHNDLASAAERLTESSTLADQLGDGRTQAITLGTLAMLELHRGNTAAARTYADRGMQVLEGSDDRWARGILHGTCGKVLSSQSDFVNARVRYRVSLMLLREVGDQRSQADILLSLGRTMRLQGKLRSAHFLYQKGLALFQQVGDRWNQTGCLNSIGEILRVQGNYVEAQSHLEACLALAEALGSQQERAAALTGLGQLAICQGDVQKAARSLKESLRLTREIGHTPGIALLLWGMGDLERLQGNREKATGYYEQCLTLTRSLGDKVTMSGALFGLGDIARLQQEHARACTLLKQSIHLAWEIGDRPGLAASLEAFASLCHQIALPERATLFLATAEALREAIQTPVTLAYHAEHEREITALREAIGEEAFHENWAYGHTMSLKLAISMVARIRVPEKADQLPEKPGLVYPAGLTAREVDVLHLVAAGLTDARIAETLVISPRTVNTHLRSIYAKLGVSSRSAATRFAFEHNLA